jgi:hypothetical protein
MIADSEPSGFATAEPVSPTSHSMEETVARLTALAEILSEQVGVLQQQMSVLQTEADTSREEATGLRTRVADLESVMMRQLAAETPVEKLWDQKKNPSTTKGDVLSRRSRSMRKSPLVGAISEDESTSGEEEEFAVSSSHPRGARVPGLTEQVTRRPEFKQLVSYRTYRLLDISQGVDSTVTGRVNTLLKRLKHHLDYKFSGDPAIQVVDFLHLFKESCDLNDISEGAAALILPYFLDGRAKSGLASRMKKIPPSMPKYPAAVQYLLQSFATEGVISAACQRVSTAKQLPEEDEKSFANRLDKYAAEAGSVFSEDALISSFVDGLLPYAGNTVRGQVTPQMTFAEVQILAENVGAAGRSLMTPGRSQIRWSMPSTPTGRPKLTLAASAESSPLQSQESYIHSSVGVPIVAAVAEDTPFSEGNIAPGSPSTSIPTRGWVSPAGSVVDETAFAIAGRQPSCHLCFTPGHFLMDCPFLGQDSRIAAQKQRDLKFKDNQPGRSNVSRFGAPVPRYPPWASTVGPAQRMTDRSELAKPTPTGDTAALAVHPADEETETPGYVLPPNSSTPMAKND